ncbi:lipopolysaccharide export system permease protein [Paracoccus alcaliphilus]|uniref:Lipopolysaccharide export system permease protein n=1 Tax=Paracoccus alcaliphilus TaxID=34002 RepID=A0A1H8L3D1_9RHOB|nr:LPS export ABC transporter permease LptF [Paracoccus alcaliphilus]WCR18084.1 LPS export ABC transporter permease LptF [Paracoccus alcaliphilus]SEN99682.1 lipopolysaccharide export system permease protein [Paracoccus alcaliphilus]
MPRIDRYILGQMLTLFGFFALVLVSVYWINRAVSLFDDLLNDGQTALVVLEFTMLTLPLVISVVLPVAAFAATAYGTNRLAGESEMVAMQAAGLSPWRLARPILVFGLSVGIMVTILVHGLVPLARERLAERQTEIAENVTAQFLRPGSFQYPTDGITLFIRDIATDGRLLDLFIEDARNPDNQITYTSEEALVVRTDTGPVLVLLQGMAQTLRYQGGRQNLAVTRFSEFSYDIGEMISSSDRRGRDLRDYSTWRLLTPDAELLEATGRTPPDARREAHERLAQPLLAPIAAMIGFATLLIGGYSRFGVWRQVFWAILGLIAVQFLTNAAANAAGRDPAMWPLLYLPAAFGGALCVLLLWLAARPRRLPGSAAGGVRT